MKFLSNIIFAVIMMAGGYVFYTTEIFPQYDVPVPKIGGILLLIFGFVLLIIAIKKRKLKSVNDYLICKNCLKTYLRSENKNHKCPNCSIILDELDGFYERNSKIEA